MGKLEGKVAAITGGTRSIGRAMADAFLAEGAKVVVNGRDEAKGQQCLAEMNAGDNAAFYAGDASTQETSEGIVDFAIDTYGQLDILCLNSGGVLNTAPVAMMSDEEWKLEVDWNLNSVFWGMRKGLQHMLERDTGRILVTSSVEGKLGKPGIPGYAATKHAVNGSGEGRGAGDGHHRGHGQRDPARARSRPTSCVPPAPIRRWRWVSTATTR